MSEEQKQNIWVYFFSGKTCKYCTEPKILLEDFIEVSPNVPVLFNDMEDDLFKYFCLEKVPSMVVLKTDGVITKFIGRKMVCDEIKSMLNL